MPDLKQVIANALGVSKDEVKDDTNMSNTESWDSLSHLQLISNLEDAYDVKINTDDMMQMVSVDAIQDILKKNGAQV